jgi:23S rRNA (guanosine2251-2'-O)-methyltransferase
MEKKVKLIYGKRSALEYIQKKFSDGSDLQIREVFAKKNPSQDIQEIIAPIPKHIKIQYLNQSELDFKFKGVNHQGIILSVVDSNNIQFKKDFSGLKQYLEENKTPILILDRIQDAGNLGNILRTAECFGFKTIVLSERDSVGVTEAVIRVSSGAVHHLNIFIVMNLSQVVDYLKEIGYWILATSDRGLDSWEKLPQPNELAIVMGNEGEGVKRLLLEKADFVCQIPMHGEISSLNVVVATGIVLDRVTNRN